MTLYGVIYEATDHIGAKGRLILQTSADGITWSSASEIYADATYDVRNGGILRTSAGTLLVSFCLVDHTEYAAAVLSGDYSAYFIAGGMYVIRSTDNGATWGSPINLGDTFTTGSISGGPPVQLSDDTLICPFYGYNTGESVNRRSVRVMTSADDGLTWGSEVTVSNGVTRGNDLAEPCLTVYGADQLLCFIRNVSTTNTEKVLSTDGGATWGTPAAIFSSIGKPIACTMASGRLVVTGRDNTTNYPILHHSTTNGATWSIKHVIDDTGLVMMYAAPFEVSAGTLGVLYGTTTVGGGSSDVRYKAVLESALQ